jgi:phage-related protein
VLGDPKYADIDWAGNTLEVLSSWPDSIKDTMGFELRKVQCGEVPDIGKPLPGIGSGVWELREDEANVCYRLAYLPRKNNVVYVLHCFEKKTQQTPRTAAESIERRFKDAQRKMREKKS